MSKSGASPHPRLPAEQTAVGLDYRRSPLPGAFHEPSQLELKIPLELSPATAPSTQSRLKALSAVAIGNAIEWYDMAIYTVMAPIYANLFFPSGNSTAQLLAAFALFGVGL